MSMHRRRLRRLRLPMAVLAGRPAFNVTFGWGVFSPRLSFTRAQASGARSTAIGADGVTWAEFGPDVPRFTGTARRLVGEGQATNGVRNPRAEGGATPTNWIVFASNGVTATPVGITTYQGQVCWRVNIAGTATANGALQVYFETPTGISAVAGQTWTTSVDVAAENLIGPSFASIVHDENTSGGVFVTFSASSVALPSASFVRVNGSRLLTGGTTGAYLPYYRLAYTAGAVVSGSVFFRLPHAEQGAFPTTPVLPAVGAPAASTRGADVVSAPGNVLFPSGVGTIYFEGVLPFAGLAGGPDRLIYERSDGSGANRIRLRANSLGNALTVGRVIGGVSADAPGLGSIAPGSLFRGAMTFDGSEIRACLSGQPERSITGIPPGLNLDRFGNTVSNFGPLNGELAMRDSPIITARGRLQSVIDRFAS